MEQYFLLPLQLLSPCISIFHSGTALAVRTGYYAPLLGRKSAALHSPFVVEHRLQIWTGEGAQSIVFARKHVHKDPRAVLWYYNMAAVIVRW